MAWSLTNSDIVQAMPRLSDFYDKADIGSTTSATCARLIGLNEDEVVGSILSFIEGDNAGTDATITGFDDATGEMSFDALSDSVAVGDVFGIISLNYQSYIARAYSIIENELRNMGKKADNFINTAQVKELHLLKVLQIICMAKRQDATTDDVFHQSYLDFSEQYRNELAALRADYDKNEDGLIDENEEQQKTQVFLAT